MFYSQAATPLLWHRVSLEAELGSKVPRGKVQAPGSEHFLLPHGPAEAPNPSGHQDAEPGWAGPSAPPTETGADGTMAAAAAAADSLQRIKAEATCSVCLGLLRDPMTNECGHSFCKPCITQICKGREAASCPQCRLRLQKKHLRPNRDLKNIAEILRSQAVGKPAEWNTCERHQQPLQLYCTEDQIAICVVCMLSKAHHGHTVVPVEEALQEYRGKMAEQLGVIESSCGKLHQFVNQIWKHLPQNEREEERQNMARVCEKLTVLKVHMGNLEQRSEDPGSQTESEELLSESYSPGREVSERTELQGHSGREPGSEPAAGMQEKTRTHVSKEAPTPNPELSQGSLDTAIHKISDTRGDAEPKVDAQQAENRYEDPGSQMEPQDSLSRNYSPGREVSKRTERQRHSVEVTLDPATAHPRLRLSEDRKSVIYGDTRQDLPDNPERFNISACVLGSEGFTSGRRYWEVEVGPKRGWAIGVARDSVQRKGWNIQLKPDFGIWALDSSERSQVPRKVGVYLDYEGGQVRFYNAETMALISSLTATFTGRLVPFFLLWAVGSRLTLSPSQR